MAFLRQRKNIGFAGKSFPEIGRLPLWQKGCLLHPHNTLKILPFIALGVLPPLSMQAQTLAAFLGAEILQASKEDTSMTDHEKLFEHRCAVIEKYIGFDDTPMSKAIEYSCRDLVIGIVFYAGSDLGKHSPEKVANLIEGKLAYYGMPSKVFIKKDHDSGSNMAFFVNGEPYKSDPVSPVEAVRFAKALATDALLTFMESGQITRDEFFDRVESSPAVKSSKGS